MCTMKQRAIMIIITLLHVLQEVIITRVEFTNLMRVWSALPVAESVETPSLQYIGLTSG